MTTLCLVLTIFIFGLFTSCRCEEYDSLLDMLTPYLTHHGPKHRSHREIKDCQHVKYGNRTHHKIKAYSSDSIELPLVNSQHQLLEVQHYYTKSSVLVHLETVNNPLRTFSVLEPKGPGTCENGNWTRATVKESAQQKDCIVATNAGFFNTHTGACLGNVISDGRYVQDSGGIQNAHFGLTDDGYIYVGYLSELDLLTQNFRQLVGGVLWLIRDGESYVDESIKLECSDTEETERFYGSCTRRFNAWTILGNEQVALCLLSNTSGHTSLLFGYYRRLSSILNMTDTYLQRGTMWSSISAKILETTFDWLKFLSDRTCDSWEYC